MLHSIPTFTEFLRQRHLLTFLLGQSAGQTFLALIG